MSIYHNLALRSNGTVIAWGDNSCGQTNVPTAMANIGAIAAGGSHSLAIASSQAAQAATRGTLLQFR